MAAQKGIKNIWICVSEIRRHRRGEVNNHLDDHTLVLRHYAFIKEDVPIYLRRYAQVEAHRLGLSDGRQEGSVS
jgi:hypothetical protein